MYSLSPGDLLSITGKVNELKVITVEGFGTKPRISSSYPMIIKLDNFNDQFWLNGGYSKTFETIQKQVSLNDIVKVYYRTKTQSFFGFGKRYNIYQLEKNNQIIFSIAETKKASLFSFEIYILQALLFAGLSFIIKRKTVVKSI